MSGKQQIFSWGISLTTFLYHTIPHKSLVGQTAYVCHIQFHRSMARYWSCALSPRDPQLSFQVGKRGCTDGLAVGRQSMTHRGVQQIFPIMHPGQRSGGSPLRHEVRETRMCCHKLVQGSDSSSPTEQLLTPLFW